MARWIDGVDPPDLAVVKQALRRALERAEEREANFLKTSKPQTEEEINFLRKRLTAAFEELEYGEGA
ncbi:hypothetical protein [Streptomyces sp. NPDC002599]|uniref:hypothetical protein n=1 Tax=Streptomyces sp. NPDC002599 TaxID=3154421 RepID=UPI00331BA8E2